MRPYDIPGWEETGASSGTVSVPSAVMRSYETTSPLQIGQLLCSAVHRNRHASLRAGIRNFARRSYLTKIRVCMAVYSHGCSLHHRKRSTPDSIRVRPQPRDLVLTVLHVCNQYSYRPNHSQSERNSGQGIRSSPPISQIQRTEKVWVGLKFIQGAQEQRELTTRRDFKTSLVTWDRE